MNSSDHNLELTKRIANHWDNKALSKTKTKPKQWMQSKKIVRYINRLVVGEPLEGLNSGLVELLKRSYPNRTFERGISVGSGKGQKEMKLLRLGLVAHFDLYELSEARIRLGIELAKKFDLSDRVTFHQVDAFKAVTDAHSYEFVHWDNSLHHMMNVDEAIHWSKKILQPGGVFFMNDFVGPSRFQWSDTVLDLVNAIRELLPPRYFENKIGPRRVPRRISRPDKERIFQIDPSEAADSGDILPALKRHFPKAKIVETGGAIYRLATRRILDNIDDDDPLLDRLLEIDQFCISLGESHFAVALAQKQP